MNSTIAILVTHAFTTQIPDAPPITVDVSLFNSCIMRDEETGELYGPDIDTWHLIAEHMGLPDDGYRFRVVEFKNIFSDVAAKRADAGLSCISATAERMKTFQAAFTLPYLDGVGIGVMIRKETDGNGSRFFKLATLKTIGFWFTLWLILLGTAGLILFLLGRSHEHKEETLPQGMYRATWGAFATATTIGYGDVVYSKPTPRMFSVLLWMVSTAIVGFMCADITSSATVEDLGSRMWTVKDLRGKHIAVVKDTTSESATRGLGASVTPTAHIEDAFRLLLSKHVDAIVFDVTALRYLESNGNADSVRVLPGTLTNEYYSIVVPNGSQMKTAIDQAILTLREDGRLERVRQRWYGTAE